MAVSPVDLPDLPRPRILIVSGDEALSGAIQATLEAADYVTYVRPDTRHALDVIYNEPPNAIILSQDIDTAMCEGFATDLKNDNVFSHLPIVLLVPAEALATPVNWADLPVDEYVTLPLDSAELVQRLEFTLVRRLRELGSNPLTRLPGNDSIVKEIQRRLDRKDDFTLVYVDVDNFKAFNDAYGFTRGDEVLRMIARVLVNAIRPVRDRGGFVGHVGGDDFVLMLPLSEAEGTCAQIIGNFDLIVPTFYNEADRTRGHIEGRDRQGEVRTFPLMSLTLAGVPNREGRLSHYGEASTIAAELKKLGKRTPGSIYVVDRRSGAYGSPRESPSGDEDA